MKTDEDDAENIKNQDTVAEASVKVPERTSFGSTLPLSEKDSRIGELDFSSDYAEKSSAVDENKYVDEFNQMTKNKLKAKSEK